MGNLKIDLLARDGSPLGCTEKTIWGDSFRAGVGGSELALLTLCQEWTRAGHDVCLYNNPSDPTASSFSQKAINEFDPDADRDFLIVVRSPNPKAINAKGMKIWLSHDQHTIDDFRVFAPFMDKIVVISEFHADFFSNTYGIENTIVIDIPVRRYDYCNWDIERIPNRVLFSSVPDRGLENLWRIWPKIKKEIPEAELVITSDYRLWGGSAGDNHFRSRWIAHDGYKYNGAMPREEFIQEQLKADILLYPSNYDELFCIAVAEAQFAGAYPITSSSGALRTTNMGTVIAVDANNPRNDHLFIDETIRLLRDRNELEIRREEVMAKAIKRFHPDNILRQWEEKVFNENSSNI